MKKNIDNITSVRASPIRALCSLFSDSSPIFSDIAAAFRSASVAAALLEIFWLTLACKDSEDSWELGLFLGYLVPVPSVGTLVSNFWTGEVICSFWNQ